MREFSMKMLQTKTQQKCGAHFVRVCAVEMHMEISQQNFYARIYTINAASLGAPGEAAGRR